MVDTMGHIAMGLLWAIPAWVLWNRRVALAFVGVAAAAAVVPDVDVFLSAWFPGQFHHHGVSHTVAFVAATSVVVGAVAAATMTRPVDRWLESERFDAGSLSVFASTALLVGGLSHVFADMLSAPDVSTPIEPFWPFFDKPWSVDVIWYDDPVWNVGFLTVMVVVHVAVAYLVTPREHRHRIAEL